MTSLQDNSSALLISVQQQWRELLSQSSTEYSPFLGYRALEVRDESWVLDTDQCVFLFMDFADRAGLNLEEFGRRLGEDGAGSKFLVGIAFRTILEVEGYYVERPHASSWHAVPKDLLLAVGAVIIGIATGESTACGPIVSGAIGGVGSLLINILASRYSGSTPRRIDFYGDLVCQLIEDHQPVSHSMLLEYTKFHEAVLNKALKKLEDSNDIVRSTSDDGEISFECHRGAEHN